MAIIRIDYSTVNDIIPDLAKPEPYIVGTDLIRPLILYHFAQDFTDKGLIYYRM